MPTERRFPPTIVIGMHRSGTGMITWMLEGLGVFMGRRMEENREALFFLRINEWVLRQAGARWDHPEPVRDLLDAPEPARLVGEYVRELAGGPRTVSYLGWARYLRYRSLERLREPWGWKDPRNTFTLPLWLELFPEARVVHVIRHGVDVALSLRRRHLQAVARAQALWRRRRVPAWIRGRPEFIESVRSASLDGGFSLWETYVAEAQRQTLGLGDRALEVRYEECLADPQSALDLLSTFCGRSLSDARRDELAGGLSSSRAYAFRSDPDARAYARRVAARLGAFGYGSASDDAPTQSSAARSPDRGEGA